MIYSSPAKINWYLHITGRRPDGFHELETLMLPITVADEVRIEPSESGIELTCSDPALPCNETNLAWRAAERFAQSFGNVAGVKIHLHKIIPMGAGLGGGSSNAATVLLGLREMFRPELSDQALAEVAAGLGSDVPFFIYGKPAICRGRGEIIEPIVWTAPIQGLLVHPGFGVPTPWAYQTYAAHPQPGITGKTLAGHALRNDLEPPAFSKYLWLPTAKKWFQEQPEVDDALMSGSGSSLFAVLRSGVNGEGLRERFRAEFGTDLFARLFTLKA